MNVLLINGSPRGKNSNTYKIASSFVEGIKKGSDNTAVEVLTLTELDVKHCIGCFACWNKTPGECVIKDDMTEVMEKMVWADVTIWSFPLYAFGVPGIVKDVLDRKLPLNLPFMIKGISGGGMQVRYGKNYKKHVVIATCGFYTAEANFDGITAQFNRLFGMGNCEKIYRSQGPLLGFPEFFKITNKYLNIVEKAGEEYATTGISADTRTKLDKLLLPRENYEEMADISWGFDRQTNKVYDNSFVTTQRLAAMYNKKSFAGQNIVLEFEYTDIDKRYQLILKADGCQIIEDNFLNFTTKIQVPFADWYDIMCGKYTMEDAYSKQLYKVTGKMDILIRWDSCFG